MTPSRKATEDPVRRTAPQKVAVSNRSASAKAAPRASITNIGPMPPMWNMGAATT